MTTLFIYIHNQKLTSFLQAFKILIKHSSLSCSTLLSTKMASLLVLLKALMGVYRHDDDEGYGGNFERKLDVSKHGSKLFEFEFLSCVTMEGGGDEDAEEYLKKVWKLLGQSCLWP